MRGEKLSRSRPGRYRNLKGNASEFAFKILKEDKESRARLGVIKTRRGYIDIPYFVPVATLASVRALGSDDLDALGFQCVLANTYHLHLNLETS
jgi:queuine tRNA-ribosyltransferase